MTWNEPVNGWELVIGFVLTFVAAWVGAGFALSSQTLLSRARRHWENTRPVDPSWAFELDRTTGVVTVTAMREKALNVRAFYPFGTDRSVLAEDPFMDVGDSIELKVDLSTDGAGVSMYWDRPKQPSKWNWWYHFPGAKDHLMPPYESCSFDEMAEPGGGEANWHERDRMEREYGNPN